MQNNNIIYYQLKETANIIRIFNVLNDILRYQEFLDFCKHVQIIKEHEYTDLKGDKIIKRRAQVHIIYAHLSHHYICDIVSNYNQFTIEVFIKSQYFKSLYVKWSLSKVKNIKTTLLLSQKTNKPKTLVNFEMRYDLQFSFLNSFAKEIIKEKIKKVITSFRDEIYKQ